MTHALLVRTDAAGAGAREGGGTRLRRDDLIDRAVDRARMGDRDAVAFLYRRYAAAVHAYVHSVVRNDHDAEDVTQHVFAKLMTVLDRYDPGGAPFHAWLRRLAHNAAVDHVRSRRSPTADAEAGADQRADDLHAERRRSLREALAALPGEQRDVVVLRHVVGLSPGEIAERLGRTESAVHLLHHRGRQALCAELLRHEAAPCTGAGRHAA